MTTPIIFPTPEPFKSHRHLKEAAKARYGLELTDADVDEITAQCRSGQRPIRSFSNDGHGRPSQHHAVSIRGVKMCVVFKRGIAATILPPDWLPHDTDTAMAAAFRKAASGSSTAP